jgi:hypothetical protein
MRISVEKDVVSSDTLSLIPEGVGMSRRKYYLHQRGKVYYAELTDPATGAKLTARSTGATNRDDALLKVAEWLKNGIPTGRTHKPRPVMEAAGVEAILRAIHKSDLTADDALRIVDELKRKRLIDTPAIKHQKDTLLFVDFLNTFWNYENSPYIREKHAHGQSIGRRHCQDCLRYVKYWREVFDGRTLASITHEELKAFSITLAEREFAPATVNKIILVGTTALGWAVVNKMIAVNPAEGLMRFTGKPEKRGVLTVDEAGQLFSMAWADKRAYIASLLSATTGLRSGEVLALKRATIDGDVLIVRHSWNVIDGLKCPKNGEVRRVPIMPEVKALLLALADEAESIYGEGTFIFYSTLPDKQSFVRWPACQYGHRNA